MTIGCTKDNCTVAETGICLAENPPETCSFRIKGQVDDGSAASPEPPLLKPERNPSLPHSRAFTPLLAQQLMSDRYCTLVGILGDPDAGKTAALVSLFLLASKDKLTEFSFADSRTLMAFNEISQGALDWNEDNPRTSSRSTPSRQTTVCRVFCICAYGMEKRKRSTSCCQICRGNGRNLL